jgi:hypothetical protein
MPLHICCFGGNKNSTKPLHVLCFGDSLTVGWWAGTEIHPYAIKLKEQLLSSKLPGYQSVITDVEGQSGDIVNSPPGDFLERMQKRCISNHSPAIPRHPLPRTWNQGENRKAKPI